MTSRVDSGAGRLEWVPVAKLRVSVRAQRNHDKPGAVARIDEIAANFDPDKFGMLTVSKREGTFWIVDGGHRYRALLKLGWENQQVQCWVYHELTEEQEAGLFLDLNNVRVVSAMDKFVVAVVAGREVETAINAIVRNAGLTVGHAKVRGVGCVTSLIKVYDTGGPAVLSTVLRIIRDSYGERGFSAKLVIGLGLFVANYEQTFHEDRLVRNLSRKLGGVNGLLGRAEQIKSSHGVTMAVAIAAATVEVYNTGRGGAKLDGWWSKLAAAEKEAS